MKTKDLEQEMSGRAKLNAFLEKNGLPPIDWQIENLAR